MNGKVFIHKLGTFFLIAMLLASCSDDGADICISKTSELSIKFMRIEEGIELNKQSLVVNKFIETRGYKIWESSESVWLDLRFNFIGVTTDNQEYSGYIQFASLEADLNKVILSDNSWKYIDPLDMKNFLSEDLVIVLNNSGFNDSNDDEAISNVEMTNEILHVNRSFSGSAWQPYNDGNKGYKILEASFRTYVSL